MVTHSVRKKSMHHCYKSRCLQSLTIFKIRSIFYIKSGEFLKTVIQKMNITSNTFVYSTDAETQGLLGAGFAGPIGNFLSCSFV
jgi:hypothetical protein